MDNLGAPPEKTIYIKLIFLNVREKRLRKLVAMGS